MTTATVNPSGLMPYRVVRADNGHVLCTAMSAREAEGRAYIHSLLRSLPAPLVVQRRDVDGEWITVARTK